MRIRTQTDSKCASLCEYATLNRHPEQVSDGLFRVHPFFDPRDLVQVKYEMLQMLRGRGAGWAAASTQGPPAGSQADRRCLDLYLGYTKGRTRAAHSRLAMARGQTVWHLSASAQYRKGAGAAPKKGLTANAASEASHPTVVRNMAECEKQYEILRRQALEPGETTTCNGLELAFIERRGLAAWMAYVPPCPPPGAGSADLQIAETETPGCDLILALAALVLGDRLEEQDDRAD